MLCLFWAEDEVNVIASSVIGGTIKHIVSSLGFDAAWWSNITAELCSACSW